MQPQKGCWHLLQHGRAFRTNSTTSWGSKAGPLYMLLGPKVGRHYSCTWNGRDSPKRGARLPCALSADILGPEELQNSIGAHIPDTAIVSHTPYIPQKEMGIVLAFALVSHQAPMRLPEGIKGCGSLVGGIWKLRTSQLFTCRWLRNRGPMHLYLHRYSYILENMWVIMI